MNLRAVIFTCITLTSHVQIKSQTTVSSKPQNARLFMRAPDVLPGTLPEMRKADFWISRMKDPDSVIMQPQTIRQMNMDFIKKMKNPEMIDTADLSLIRKKLEATPGLYESYPDLYKEKPEIVYSIKHLMINNEIAFMRRGEFGNMLAIQYSPEELYGIENEMSLNTVDELFQPGISVEDVCLRIIPQISPEIVGLSDKNRTRWDIWNLDIIPIGSPVIILHRSSSGGFLFVFSDYGYGWVRAEKIAMTNREEIDKYVSSKNFVVCTGDKVPFYSNEYARYVSGRFRMGDHLPMADSTGLKVLVPARMVNGTLLIQTAWLAPGADVHKGYLAYTRRNIVVQSLKLLDNIYDWTGAWMGRNHATAIRDVFACFGFRLPSTGEFLSVYNNKITRLSATESKEQQYKKMSANEPFVTLQICSTGHSQLFLGDYNDVPIVYDTHGYGYTDSAGNQLDIRRSCIETIALPDYFLKQNVVFLEMK